VKDPINSDDKQAQELKYVGWKKVIAGAGDHYRTRYIPHFLAVISFLFLIYVSALFWLEMQEKFPKIEQGSYIGEISGLSGEEAFKKNSSPDGQNALHDSFKIYLEASANKDEYFLVLMKKGFGAFFAKTEARGYSKRSSEFLMPLTLVRGEETYKFVGSKLGKGSYAGVVTNIEKGFEGRWRLHTLKENSSYNAFNEKVVRDLLGLKSEIISLSEQISEKEQKIPMLKSEVEQLTNFITEDKSLRLTAEKKLEDLMKKVEEAGVKSNEKKQELKVIKERYDLVQKLSPAGKLVSLARETLERESRCIDGQIRIASGAVLSDYDPEILMRGEAIAQLRKEIATEKKKIDLLKKRYEIE
jgi:regulator of replication initiation timing